MRTNEKRAFSSCWLPNMTKWLRTGSSRSTTLAPNTVSPISNGHWTNPTSNPRDSVPSACYRKGKRRKDIDLTKSLWDNGKPHYLQRKFERKDGGTWSNLFTCESDLISGQVRLDPTMDVSDNSTSPQLCLRLKMVLARRAHHRRRTCVLQSWGLRFSRFAGNRVR